MSQAPDNIPPPSDGSEGGPIRAGCAKRLPLKGRKLPAGAIGKGKRFLEPVPQGRRKGVLGIGVLFTVVFIAIGWYYGIKVPSDQKLAALQAELQRKEAEYKKAQEETKAQIEAMQARQNMVGGLIIKTRPSGAMVTLGGESVLKSPANFLKVKIGKYPVKITLDGYEDVIFEVGIKEDQFVEPPLVELVHSVGGVDLSSSQEGTEFELRSGDKAVASGKLPFSQKNIPIGEYLLVARRGDWEKSQKITVNRNQTTPINVDFVYATVVLASDPAGAVVKVGKQEMGQTPLTLTVKPGDVAYTISLFGYKAQTLSGAAESAKTLNLRASLEISKDILNSAGMEMIWLPAGYWAGKYEVLQSEYEKVTGQRPSAFSGLRRPADNVSWNSASDFCRKLTEMDRKAGKLPSGFVYSLPTESQWDYLAADATLENAVVSEKISRNGTEVAGTMEPNKFGLYDVRGNVWELTLGQYDANRYAIRGACWLTSRASSLDIAYREGVRPDYKDRFIGFRVVLVREP